MNAGAAAFYPRSRDKDCGGVGSSQSREDPHNSNGIPGKIDFSLPTDLSGRDITSVTQVTQDGSRSNDEERAIQVSTAG